MSLINRMLQDLSLRQPAAADVNAGLSFAVVAEPPPAPARREFGLLLALTVVFTAALWWVFAAGTPAPLNAIESAQAAPQGARWSYLSLDASLDLARVAAAAPAFVPAPRALRLSAALQEPPARPAPPGDSTRGQADLAAAEAAPPREVASISAPRQRLGKPEAASAPPAAVDGAALLEAARLELARGDADAALRRLQEAPATLVANPEHQGLVASAYQRLGQHEQAAAAYRELLRRQPEQAHWWAGYGISQDALAQRGEALHAYRQALTLGALDARVRDYLLRRSAALAEKG